MNNSMRPLLSVLLFGMLIGCTTEQPQRRLYWHKDGATQAAFEVDRGQCEAMEASTRQQPYPQQYSSGAQALSSAFMAGQAAGARYTEVVDACMRGKGWQLRPF